MSIYNTTRIKCQECSYEEPNDYYHGERKWIFITDVEEDEEIHFCSEKCLNYAAETDKLILTSRKDISNASEEFRDILRDYKD